MAETSKQRLAIIMNGILVRLKDDIRDLCYLSDDYHKQINNAFHVARNMNSTSKQYFEAKQTITEYTEKARANDLCLKYLHEILKDIEKTLNKNEIDLEECMARRGGLFGKDYNEMNTNEKHMFNFIEDIRRANPFLNKE